MIGFRNMARHIKSRNRQSGSSEGANLTAYAFFCCPRADTCEQIKANHLSLT
jgi:hypothetical protein